MSKLYDKYKAIQKIGCNITIPHDVWKCFGGEIKEISVVGNQVSLGEDYVSIEEARNAAEWFVKQLGGQVKWQKP